MFCCSFFASVSEMLPIEIKYILVWIDVSNQIGNINNFFVGKPFKRWPTLRCGASMMDLFPPMGQLEM